MSHCFSQSQYWVYHFHKVSAGRDASYHFPARLACSRGPRTPGSEADPSLPSALRLQDARFWPQTSGSFALAMPFSNLPHSSGFLIPEISFPFHFYSSHPGQYSIGPPHGLPIGLPTEELESSGSYQPESQALDFLLQHSLASV